MKFIDKLKASIPDWAKDIRLNCDAVLLRSTLSPEQAAAVALAAAYSVGNNTLATAICSESVLSPAIETGCLTAASLMAMNNIWYPYVDMSCDADLKSMPAQLRMNAYANYGGIAKTDFEMCALAASIVGKCEFCVHSHYALLRDEGVSREQLRDVGRIVAVIVAASRAVQHAKAVGLA